MAVSGSQDQSRPTAKEQAAAERVDAQPKTREEVLAADLSKHYGVDAPKSDKDYEQFIKDVVAVREDRSRPERVYDPLEQARLDEKIQELRQRTAEQSKGSAEQQALAKALKDSDVDGVSVSFPDDRSFVLNAGGKEDSGSADIGADAFMAAVRNLKSGGYAG